MEDDEVVVEEFDDSCGGAVSGCGDGGGGGVGERGVVGL